jgi:hypothetical protein
MNHQNIDQKSSVKFNLLRSNQRKIHTRYDSFETLDIFKHNEQKVCQVLPLD